MNQREFIIDALRSQGQAMFLFDEEPPREDVYCAVTLADIYRVLRTLQVDCGNCEHFRDDSEFIDGYKTYEAYICALGVEDFGCADPEAFGCNCWDGPVKCATDEFCLGK